MKKLSCHRRSGFTLIEIMVVVIILGILAATIIPQFMGTTHDAKVSTAKANIAELGNAVSRFYVTLDRYPTAEEGLKVLVDPPTGDEKKWRGPYIDLLRPDPWGNPYQYRNPGVRRPTSFDIWSRGADGADGSDCPDRDHGRRHCARDERQLRRRALARDEPAPGRCLPSRL